MTRVHFNHILYSYHFWYEQFEAAKKKYEKEKAEYRIFAEADNQIGKPGHHLPYEPPLTMMKKSEIRKIHAQRCKEAKIHVKDMQRIFESERRYFERQLLESGLTLY